MHLHYNEPLQILTRRRSRTHAVKRPTDANGGGRRPPAVNPDLRNALDTFRRKAATRDLRLATNKSNIFVAASARVGTRTATKTDTLNQNKFVLSCPQEHEHDAHTYDERTFDLTTHITRALKVSRGQPRNAHDHNAGYCKRQFCMQKKSLSKFCANGQCTSQAHREASSNSIQREEREHV